MVRNFEINVPYSTLLDLAFHWKCTSLGPSRTPDLYDVTELLHAPFFLTSAP